MDFNDVSNSLIERIKSYFPEDKNVISFLEDTLNLGRQSVYRRLRGEIPFTFNEIITIALYFGISIDEIIGKHHNKGTFLELYLEKDWDKLVYSFALDSLELIRDMSKANESSMISVFNRLPMTLTMDFENISRFKYYKSMHQQQDQTSDLFFSDISYPSELDKIFKKIRYYFKHINEITVILDNNSFLSLIKDITYFYRRNLITDEDLQSLKAEFQELLDGFERLLIKGESDNGQKFHIYISTLNIEVNYTYFHSDNKENIKFWANAETPMVIQDPYISQMQKKRLDSIKKYSALITQSNEVQRSAYIYKQREYIDNIGKENILL